MLNPKKHWHYTSRKKARAQEGKLVNGSGQRVQPCGPMQKLPPGKPVGLGGAQRGKVRLKAAMKKLTTSKQRQQPSSPNKSKAQSGKPKTSKKHPEGDLWRWHIKSSGHFMPPRVGVEEGSSCREHGVQGGSPFVQEREGLTFGDMQERIQKAVPHICKAFKQGQGIRHENIAAAVARRYKENAPLCKLAGQYLSALDYLTAARNDNIVEIPRLVGTFGFDMLNMPHGNAQARQAGADRGVAKRKGRHPAGANQARAETAGTDLRKGKEQAVHIPVVTEPKVAVRTESVTEPDVVAAQVQVAPGEVKPREGQEVEPLNYKEAAEKTKQDNSKRAEEQPKEGCTAPSGPQSRRSADDSTGAAKKGAQEEAGAQSTPGSKWQRLVVIAGLHEASQVKQVVEEVGWADKVQGEPTRIILRESQHNDLVELGAFEPACVVELASASDAQGLVRELHGRMAGGLRVWARQREVSTARLLESSVLLQGIPQKCCTKELAEVIEGPEFVWNVEMALVRNKRLSLTALIMYTCPSDAEAGLQRLEGATLGGQKLFASLAAEDGGLCAKEVLTAAAEDRRAAMLALEGKEKGVPSMAAPSPSTSALPESPAEVCPKQFAAVEDDNAVTRPPSGGAATNRKGLSVQKGVLLEDSEISPQERQAEVNADVKAKEVQDGQQASLKTPGKQDYLKGLSSGAKRGDEVGLVEAEKKQMKGDSCQKAPLADGQDGARVFREAAFQERSAKTGSRCPAEENLEEPRVSEKAGEKRKIKQKRKGEASPGVTGSRKVEEAARVDDAPSGCKDKALFNLETPKGSTKVGPESQARHGEGKAVGREKPGEPASQQKEQTKGRTEAAEEEETPAQPALKAKAATGDEVAKEVAEGSCEPRAKGQKRPRAADGADNLAAEGIADTGSKKPTEEHYQKDASAESDKAAAEKGKGKVGEPMRTAAVNLVGLTPKPSKRVRLSEEAAAAPSQPAPSGDGEHAESSAQGEARQLAGPPEVHIAATGGDVPQNQKPKVETFTMEDGTDAFKVSYWVDGQQRTSSLVLGQYQTVHPKIDFREQYTVWLKGGGSSYTCTICMDQVNDPIFFDHLSDCKHGFHRSCLRKWLIESTYCPNCNRAVAMHKGRRLSTHRLRLSQSDLEETNPYADAFCQVCTFADREDILLLCDKCNRGGHTTCLNLDKVPEGAYYCSGCLKSIQAVQDLMPEGGRTLRCPPPPKLRRKLEADEDFVPARHVLKRLASPEEGGVKWGSERLRPKTRGISYSPGPSLRYDSETAPTGSPSLHAPQEGCVEETPQKGAKGPAATCPTPSDTTSADLGPHLQAPLQDQPPQAKQKRAGAPAGVAEIALEAISIPSNREKWKKALATVSPDKEGKYIEVIYPKEERDRSLKPAENNVGFLYRLLYMYNQVHKSKHTVLPVPSLADLLRFFDSLQQLESELKSEIASRSSQHSPPSTAGPSSRTPAKPGKRKEEEAGGNSKKRQKGEQQCQADQGAAKPGASKTPIPGGPKSTTIQGSKETPCEGPKNAPSGGLKKLPLRAQGKSRGKEKSGKKTNVKEGKGEENSSPKRNKAGQFLEGGACEECKKNHRSENYCRKTMKHTAVVWTVVEGLRKPSESACSKCKALKKGATHCRKTRQHSVEDFPPYCSTEEYFAMRRQTLKPENKTFTNNPCRECVENDRSKCFCRRIKKHTEYAWDMHKKAKGVCEDCAKASECWYFCREKHNHDAFTVTNKVLKRLKIQPRRFCEACRTQAKEEGLNVEEIKERVKQTVKANNHDEAQKAMEAQEVVGAQEAAGAQEATA